MPPLPWKAGPGSALGRGLRLANTSVAAGGDTIANHRCLARISGAAVSLALQT